MGRKKNPQGMQDELNKINKRKHYHKKKGNDDIVLKLQNKADEVNEHWPEHWPSNKAA